MPCPEEFTCYFFNSLLIIFRDFFYFAIRSCVNYSFAYCAAGYSDHMGMFAGRDRSGLWVYKEFCNPYSLGNFPVIPVGINSILVNEHSTGSSGSFTFSEIIGKTRVSCTHIKLLFLPKAVIIDNPDVLQYFLLPRGNTRNRPEIPSNCLHLPRKSPESGIRSILQINIDP